MTLFKKLICFFISVSMLFALIGCSAGNNANNSSVSSSSNGESTSTGDTAQSDKNSDSQTDSSSQTESSSPQTSVSSGSGNSSQNQGEDSGSGGASDGKVVYKPVYLNFNETTDFVLNPGRGFYYDMKADVPASGAKALLDAEWNENSELDHFGNPLATWEGGWKDEIQSYVHIGFGLQAFSAAMGGQNIPLTDDALQSIRLTFDNLRTSKMSATVRFTYDPEGVSYKTKKDIEPPLDIVLKHVEQVAKIISEYQDCIYSADTGFFGPWGEQHTTTLGSDTNKNAYYRLIETWLENTNSDFNILVRKPLLFLNWFNTKYGTNYTTSNIDTIKDTAESARISCFNDGYLANDEDYGTFTNREKEIAWLSTRQGMYGGEVEVESVNNFYATGARMVTESFKTHTTHLNYFYNQEAIKSNSKETAWKQQDYGTGMDASLIDPLYVGLKYYKYIENHLGYRLVLRSSEIGENASEKGVIYLKGSIENKGFAPVTTNKNVYIVLVCGNKTVYQSVQFDIKSITSGKTVNYEFAVNIPSDFAGEIKAYMKIGSIYDKTKEENRRQIAFANAGAQFDEQLGANLIASFTV